MIKFIDYSGKYPCLCMGTCTVEIDGKIVKFGNNLIDPECTHDRFWVTGGCVSFDGDWNEIVDEGPWEIDETSDLGEYNNLKDELIKIFNENVPWGCCGGCI